MNWTPITLVCFIGVVHGQSLQLRPTTAQLEPVTKSQNESLVVTCLSTANSSAHVWIGPTGKQITGIGRIHVENRLSLGTSLMFDRIEVFDKGVYICKLNNEQVNFTLIVTKVPQLKNTDLEQHVKEFQTKVIKCDVEGEPKPVITWQKNGVSIEEIKDRKYIADNMGLKVINATREDAGVFTCRALQFSKDASSIYSWDIRLRVQHKPEWKEPGEEVKAFGYLTGETNLTCEAVAEPGANYTWSRIKHSHKHLPHNTTEILEPGRSVLKMFVHNDSYGTYKCEAFNKLGHISRVYHLSPGEKPNPPTGLRVVEDATSVHTATLKVASDTPPGDLVGYRVQFVVTRPGVELTWNRTDYQDITKNDKGHYVIIDLLEDTGYTARVATRSVAGLSDYSDTYVTFRTLKSGQLNSSWELSCQPFLILMLLYVVLQAVH